MTEGQPASHPHSSDFLFFCIEWYHNHVTLLSILNLRHPTVRKRSEPPPAPSDIFLLNMTQTSVCLSGTRQRGPQALPRLAGC